MATIELDWTGFTSLEDLPDRLHQLNAPGIYIWRVSLPEATNQKFSYYVGSCARRYLSNRLFEHIRDALGFCYYIRDASGNWMPKDGDLFWSRISTIRENAKDVIEYLERGSYAWAVISPPHTHEAESAIYMELRKKGVRMDNARRPPGGRSINTTFRNIGAPEITALLGATLVHRSD